MKWLFKFICVMIFGLIGSLMVNYAFPELSVQRYVALYIGISFVSLYINGLWFLFDEDK